MISYYKICGKNKFYGHGNHLEENLKEMCGEITKSFILNS